MLPDGSREADGESVTGYGCPHSAEPPVRILYPRDEVTLVAVSLECVVLMCALSREDAPVRWYKDGLEVEASDALQLGAEGPTRTLTLPHAQSEDAGEYVCETRDEAVTFNVSLAGGCSWPARVWEAGAGGITELTHPLSVQSPLSSSLPQRPPLARSAWPPGSRWC